MLRDIAITCGLGRRRLIHVLFDATIRYHGRHDTWTLLPRTSRIVLMCTSWGFSMTYTSLDCITIRKSRPMSLLGRSCWCVAGADLWRFPKRVGPARFGHVSNDALGVFLHAPPHINNWQLQPQSLLQIYYSAINKDSYRGFRVIKSMHYQSWATRPYPLFVPHHQKQILDRRIPLFRIPVKVMSIHLLFTHSIRL